VANAKVGVHADGGWLYLQVTTTVAGQLNKSWLFRYSVGGRERQMGLGSLTEVKLADARQKAAECRQQRQDGIDPIEARESARRMAEASGVTFRRAFETYFATKRKSLSNAKHAAQWQSTMETYVFPSIGHRSACCSAWRWSSSPQSCAAIASRCRHVSVSRKSSARVIKSRSTIVLCLISAYLRSSPTCAPAILSPT
jgi:hypothetical protein